MTITKKAESQALCLLYCSSFALRDGDYLLWALLSALTAACTLALVDMSNVVLNCNSLGLADLGTSLTSDTSCIAGSLNSLTLIL